MNFIKNKILLFTNIAIFICLLAFAFMLQQNSVNADNSSKKLEQNVNSISDFFAKKTNTLFSSKIQESKEKYIFDFDIDSDYSLQKYISDDLVLNNKKYEPADLVQIDSEYLVNRAGRPYLRQAAQIAFESLAKDFYSQTNHYFYLMSAYRSYLDQETLFEAGCSLNRCAKIGASEHQLGLAVDIHLATQNSYIPLHGEYLDRLNHNAHKYGFINTYRKGAKIDGKMSEIWHRRYVGIPLASELYKEDLSFAEYYQLNFDK